MVERKVDGGEIFIEVLNRHDACSPTITSKSPYH